MKNKDNILIEIKEIAPNLSGIQKETAFAVPDQYFDDLSAKIQSRMISQKSQSQKAKFLSFIFQPQFAVAASIVIILMVSGTYLYNHQTTQIANNNTIYWDEILNDNTLIDKIDESLLIETYVEETQKQAINAESNTKNKSVISEEDISDYIEKEYNNDIFNEL